jgi:hypothetical protein
MPWHNAPKPVHKAILDAAGQLGICAITDDPSLFNHAASVPDCSAEKAGLPGKGVRIVQWHDCPDVVSRIQKAKAGDTGILAMVKLPLGPECAKRALELADQGADVFHVYADWLGYVESREQGDGGEDLAPVRKHVSQAVREVHLAFVQAGIRDEITLVASGGISLAEHVIKSLLCGADLVAVDVPLMIALECRVCENCRKELVCPVDLTRIGRNYAVGRITNLMGAWHSQMLEMMGAMGIREARRLRGEVGRAMFFDDLERDCFAPVFGKRKEAS